MLTRRTPMPQGKPLRRGKSLERSAMPPARVPLKRSQGKHAKPKDTGPSRKVRAMVCEREGDQCAACGKHVPAGSWRSIQHRVARGQGGGNDLFNLVLLCGSATSPGCHRRCEDREREMQARGYWLESWQDPRAEGVMLHDASGGGMTVWLDAAGGYSLTAPELVTS